VGVYGNAPAKDAFRDADVDVTVIGIDGRRLCPPRVFGLASAPGGSVGSLSVCASECRDCGSEVDHEFVCEWPKCEAPERTAGE